MGEISADATTEQAHRPPLRVGLLVDTMIQPVWVERALRRVVESGEGRIVLVVRNGAVGEADPRPPRMVSWWRNRARLLHAFFERRERRRVPPERDPMRPVDITALAGDAAEMVVTPARRGVSNFFQDEDVGRIRAVSPDVLIRLGFGILRGSILGAARYGVWSYHHGDPDRYRGGPPGFWEVMEGNPVTGVVLQRLTEALDDGQVLQRSWSATHRLSVALNRVEPYWKGAAFLERAMRRLRGSSGGLPEASPSPYGQRLYVAPTNREMAGGMLRLASRRVETKLATMFTRGQWYLAWRRRAGMPDDNREPELSPYRFRPILPPNDRFWADPFPIRSEDGRDYVFFEDYEFGTQKGVISVLELGANGPVGSPVQVLEREYHLSYPFVFRWRGAVFLLPETADIGRMEVYRAVKFPFEWTLETAMGPDFPLADCTLAEVGGRWWMFANAAESGDSFWDEMHLFHGASPLGPWEPHRLNPVVSDVRCARPAGRLFQRGGALFRPSQDCSTRYGGALNIRQITRLDARDYEEHTVGRVLPDWRPGLRGVHTVNAWGGLTVIDVQRLLGKLPWSE